MKRKHFTYLTGILTGLLLFTSCDEDHLTPSGATDNFFTVPEGLTDEVSELRRQFYDKNHLHLIFNDTLSKESIGKDAFGNDIWKVETVDLNYNLTSNSNKTINIEYFSDAASMKSAIALVERFVLPHIKGGKLQPYSIMLVKSIETEDRYGDMESVYAVNNMRCLAIAAGEWLEAEYEEERAAMGKDILITLVSGKFNSNSEEADPFYEPSKEYYGEYISDYIPDWNRNKEDIYDFGMLRYSPDWWDDDPHYDSFILSSSDFSDFFNAVMNQTEEDFTNQYAGYPIIMEKYHLMKDIITGLGYIF